MKKLKLNREQLSILVGIAVVVCVVAGILAFLVIPRWTGYTAAVAEIKRLQAQYQSFGTQQAKQSEREALLGNHKQVIARLSRELAGEEEVDSILKSFYPIANQSDIEILSFEPMKQRLPDGQAMYAEQPVLVSAEGGYHELGQFIALLEGGERIVKLKELNVAAVPDSPTRHRATMVVSTYILLEDAGQL